MTNALMGANFQLGQALQGDMQFNNRKAVNTSAAVRSFFTENGLRIIPGNDDWANTGVGSGSNPSSNFAERNLRTGATDASSIISYRAVKGLNSGEATDGYCDWTKGFILLFDIFIGASDANGIRRVQLKEATALGVLAERGIGLISTNLALTGEAYGTSRETLDLGTTLTAARIYAVEIHLTSNGVEFFVAGVSKGSITTSGKFPAVMGAASVSICYSHGTGTPAVNNDFLVYNNFIIRSI